MSGSGFGTIGKERRFFHERNRSCYLGVVENRLKRNPLVKCAKCGETGREHRGKDGHIRVRHNDRVCATLVEGVVTVADRSSWLDELEPDVNDDD